MSLSQLAMENLMVKLGVVLEPVERVSEGVREAASIKRCGVRRALAEDAGARMESTDLDSLQELADEITTLYAHVHAATHRLLMLIAEFDRLGGWKPGGHRSCAHWLSFHTGIDLGAARERMRAARALLGLPEIGASMARGELSFAKVRALTRVATPDNETELLEFARAGTAAAVERLVRGWRRLSRLDEQEMERERHRSRCFSVVPDLDGMYVVRGRLDPEVGAVLMRAIEAASDALFRQDREKLQGLADALGVGEPDALRTTPRQRRADAVGLLAERALAAGFGEGGQRSQDGDRVREGGDGRRDCDRGRVCSQNNRAGGEQGREGHVMTQADHAPEGRFRQRRPLPLSGTRAERFQVVIYVDAACLRSDPAPGPRHPGDSADRTPDLARSELEDGTRVSAETSRRLACDASRITLTTGQDGRLLDVGRKTRTVPPAIRRALEARDRGCRFPGCGLRFTDAHHIRHWADGGATTLSNLVLLCRHHHRAVHEEGFRVEVGPTGRLNFYDSQGLPLPDVPSPAYVGETPIEALIRQNRIRGIDPDVFASAARFRRDADIPWEIEAAAREVLDPW
jgi:hypothetical protein